MEQKMHVEPVFNPSGLLKNYRKTPPATPSKESSLHSSVNPLTRTNANLILQVESMLASEKIIAERHALQVDSLEQRATESESKLGESKRRIIELEAEVAQLKGVLDNEHTAAEAVADHVQELVDKEKESRSLADLLQGKIDEMTRQQEKVDSPLESPHKEQEVSRQRIAHLELMVLSFQENEMSRDADEVALINQVESLASQVEDQVAGLKMAEETVCDLEIQIKLLKDQLQAERNSRKDVMDRLDSRFGIKDSPVHFSSAGSKWREQESLPSRESISSGDFSGMRNSVRIKGRGPRRPCKDVVERSLLLSYPAAPTLGMYACHFLEVLESRGGLD